MIKEPISNLKEGQYEENKTIQLTSKTIGARSIIRRMEACQVKQPV